MSAHRPRRFTERFSQFVIALLLAVSALGNIVAPARADTALTTIAAGTQPYAVAVNPVTNKIYVANAGNNTVTVIDGATNATATINAGTAPAAVAVNPVTNKIYVANQGSDSVTVINGATNAATTVNTGMTPYAVAVNPVTNKVYVANQNSANVTVIDGTTNAASTVSAGTSPSAVAVNPVTNKIYIVNQGSNNVTVIDGATNLTTTVSTGLGPLAVAVNPVTNKIYVANQSSRTITVIDGATHVTNTVSLVTQPWVVAVNPVTNKVYVANNGGNSVAIIDGTTNGLITVSVGTNPTAVVVNPVTNKIYVANYGSASVTVIDGVTNVTTVSAGTNPWVVAVNPVTNKVYVANRGSANVTVIDGNSYPTSAVPVAGSPYGIDVDPLTDKVVVASSNLTIIDGATQLTNTVSTGLLVGVAVNPIAGKIYGGSTPIQSPLLAIDETSLVTTSISGTCVFCFDVAVNPVINQVYAVPEFENKVRLIDGATNVVTDLPVASFPTGVAVNPVTNKVYFTVGNTVAVVDAATRTLLKTVAVGTDPYSLAVNPLTNRIYVANSSSNTVSVLDGSTDTVVTTIGVGTSPRAIAVNPLTNRIYTANNSSNTVTVIDGNSQTVVATIAAGTGPLDIGIDRATNKIYVVNYGTYGVNGTVTVIDGASHTRVTNVAAGLYPTRVAINPHTQKVYATNQGSPSVTVIDPQPAWNVPLLTIISSLPGHITTSATPTFTFNKVDQIHYLPVTPPVQRFYYQVDTLTGAWTAATFNNGRWQGTTASLSNGLHTLYAYASDGQEAGTGNTLITGKISAYTFLVRVPTATYADIAGACAGNSPCYTGVQSAISHTLPGGTLTVYSGDYAESVILNQDVSINFTGDVTLTALSQLSGTLTAPIGTLTLNGDFAHTGGTFNANGGTVAFIGSNITRTLTATVPTQFYNLTIGAGITLTHSTNNDNTGVNGTLVNNGAIYKAFEFSGVSVIAKVLGGLKALAMLRYDQNHPQATPGIQTNKYWHIAAITTTVAAFDLGLTLPHNNLPDPNVCKYPGDLGGAGWDCARDGFDGLTVWRNGITALSDWAVGDLVGPTAVKVAHVAASASPIDLSGPLGLALSVAVLIIGGGMWLKRR